MRIHNHLNIQVLKIFVYIGIICLSNTIIYGQETMEDAIVSISFSEEGNTKTIIAKASDQTGLPIEDLELYFFVKRTFSLLPIGDGFNATDDEGLLEVEFPNDLPGDTEGNLIIVTQIIESDLYNDLSFETIKNWGIPIILDDPTVEERSLWAAAANAPLSLIIVVSSMIFAVWFIIWYIIFKLYKISTVRPLKL